MQIIALVLSLLVAALGAMGVVSPERLLGIVRRFESPAGLLAAAGFRVILGAVLFFAAPDSRAPGVVRILGVLIFAVGLITPLFGVRRFSRLLKWWSARSSLFTRAWAGFALAFGLLLAYAVMP